MSKVRPRCLVAVGRDRFCSRRIRQYGYGERGRRGRRGVRERPRLLLRDPPDQQPLRRVGRTGRGLRARAIGEHAILVQEQHVRPPARRVERRLAHDDEIIITILVEVAPRVVFLFDVVDEQHCRQLGVDPRPFFITICVAASASFSTPIGYQTNLIVQSIGNYKFSDYWKIGLPLNILVLIISLIVIPRFWPF